MRISAIILSIAFTSAAFSVASAQGPADPGGFGAATAGAAQSGDFGGTVSAAAQEGPNGYSSSVLTAFSENPDYLPVPNADPDGEGLPNPVGFF